MSSPDKMNLNTPIGPHEFEFEIDTREYDSAARHLAAIPLGAAAIDVEVRKLAEAGKIRAFFFDRDSAFGFVRRGILSAWWSARLITSRQEEHRRGALVLEIEPKFRAKLIGLQRALGKFASDRPITPLDMEAAIGDDRAEAIADELWSCIQATRHAAEAALDELKETELRYRRQGRPPGIALAFAGRLAKLWEELTGSRPSVTHDPYTETRKGPFVDFVEAARATLNVPDLLSENFTVAAEKAARPSRKVKPPK